LRREFALWTMSSDSYALDGMQNNRRDS